MFATSYNYTSGSGGGSAKKSIWVNRIGTYRYYAQILAGFDPIRADLIFDSRADQIAESFVSKMCYDYVEPKR
jgi:hypothetical protein